MRKPVKWRNLPLAGFIQLANEFHKKKYDYSLVSFTDIGDKVTIICPIHGEFTQKVVYHLTRAGCSFCSNEQRAKTVKAICQSRQELKSEKTENTLGLGEVSHLINTAWSVYAKDVTK